jgi:hypothetical protein
MAASDTLGVGAQLTPGQSIVSSDGRFTMIMQTDGNLVIYLEGTPLWASNTAGKPARNVIMQGDGNLVIYAPDGTPTWSSNTFGHSGATLIMQNDGNAVIYQAGTPLWSSQTDGAGTVLIGKSFNPKLRGVYGENTGGGDGVFGYGQNAGRGVVGVSENHTGVEGNSTSGTGVWGSSATGMAGHFEGNVSVTGDLLLTGADCAEQFDVMSAEVGEPGTVMVIAAGGALSPSKEPYDRKVVGVVSGAGEFKAAIVLDRKPDATRAAIALMGKVYCKVDADAAPIEVGDLITTSATAGHAMKASDTGRAFGSVIGKALRPLARGRGLIPILIGLQ